ncbi:MAG: hypothetical protein QOF70_768 [Acetobacteraceae bacterium]|jgi:hypothetical protein|nr:hypothetical protein [Acetobacteraceae bacterium]
MCRVPAVGLLAAQAVVENTIPAIATPAISTRMANDQAAVALSFERVCFNLGAS